MKALIKSTALALSLFTSSTVFAEAEKYNIDPTHSFIEFKANHMGFSWLLGRFNEMEGELNYDEKNIGNSSIKVTVNTGSLDSNHAKRDKHLKSDDYIDADKYPKATFTSKSVSQKGDDIMINGDLSFHGVTKPITIKAKLIGAGKDPWGGYRRGYEGTANFNWTDFGMKAKRTTEQSQIELRLFIEAIK